MKQRISLQLICIIIVVFTGFACDQVDPDRKDNPLNEKQQEKFLKDHLLLPPEGKNYPDNFDYYLLDGTKETLEQNRGKVVFLNFWATWCVPCKKELPDMEELLSLMENENFRMLAVSVGEDRDIVKNFMNKFPYNFDIVIDEDNEISPGFDVIGLPTTFIFNPDGNVIAQATGPRKWNDKGIVNFLRTISRNQQRL